MGFKGAFLADTELASLAQKWTEGLNDAGGQNRSSQPQIEIHIQGGLVARWGHVSGNPTNRELAGACAQRMWILFASGVSKTTLPGDCSIRSIA